MPFQNLIDDLQENQFFYQELIISVLDDWSIRENFNFPERSSLWKKLFVKINQFIFDPDTESVNFNHCLASGALIFTLKSSKIYIYFNPVIFQMLFQLLPNLPSCQLITRKLGRIPQFKPNGICIIHEFLNFMSNLAGKISESNITDGWSLHELKYTLDDIYFYKSKLMPQFFICDEKVLDAIIDDSENIFTKIALHSEDEYCDINKRFYMLNYKLPSLLSDFPPISSVCCFFNAEKCFLALCQHIKDGIESEQMQKVDDKGRSLMHFASAGGNVSLISMLLESGYSANQVDEESNTPLYYSTMFNNTATFHYLLVNGGNDLFSNYDSCAKIFHNACIFGSQSIIEFINSTINLVEFIKIDIMKSKRSSCLSISCLCGNSCAVEYILTKLYPFKSSIKKLNEILLIDFKNACQAGPLNCLRSITQFHNNFIKVIRKCKNISLLNDIASTNGHKDIICYLSPFDEDGQIKQNSVMPFPQIKEYLTTAQNEFQHDNLNEIFYKHASILESFIEDFDSEVSECQSLDDLEIDVDIFLDLENFYDIWTNYFSENDIQIKIIKSLYHSLKLSLNQLEIIIEKANNGINDLKIKEKMKLMRETKKL